MLYARRLSGICAAIVFLLLLISAVLLFLHSVASSVSAGSGHQCGVCASGELAQMKQWDFERFDVDIKVNTDGSFTVRETQVANFTGSFSFLNRDLYSGDAGYAEGRTYGRVRFKDVQVYNLDGTPYDNWKASKKDYGVNVRIEFSATNEQKGWIIEYRVTGAIIYGEDYDRLYYDTVSDVRDVPIKSSRITVELPEGANMDEVKATEYPNTSYPPGSVESGREGYVLWWQVTSIGPGTTFTIDVAFPKGLVQVPLTFRPWFGALMIALASCLALGALLFMLVRWWSKGRDVAAAEIDVVRYEPPEDLAPAMVGYLVNESSKPSDVSATIVDLAIRGTLIVSEIEGKGVFKKKQFAFERRDRSEEGLRDYEKEVLVGLFAGKDYVTEEDLRNRFYVHMANINRGIKDAVMKKELFDLEPRKAKRPYYIVGLLILVPIILIPILPIWIDLGYLWAFVPALGVASLSIFIVGHFMPRRTAAGSAALSYVKGFKEYMATAEADEMEMMTPEIFQANLPYAMVLDVADKWASNFSDIYATPPDWYHPYAGAAFSTAYLSRSLSDMQTGLAGTLSSSPSSSGSGGGGFGGGSSGGGFGGGGSSAG